MSEKTLVLVDGSSYLFRAYYALPSLTNSAGHPTGAIYGVINMLRRLLNDYNPTYLGVIFDSKTPSFRHDLYKDYKANRETMPTELAQQIEALFEIIRAMGLPLIVEHGVEADDVIGTLSQQATAAGMKTIISTGDKDMAQLVNEHVTLVNTMTNSKMDIAGVKEKFGVMPEQMIDYLALMGDTSDNVPGVPNVGPKTAAKWLNEYQSLQQLILSADKITGKVGENFRAFLPQIGLSQQLVTIKCDVKLNESPLDLTLKKPDHEKLSEAFKRFEFKAWVKEVEYQKNAEPAAENNVVAALSVEKNYFTILEEASFQQLLNRIQECALFAFDTETSSLDTVDAEIIGLSFAFAAHEAYYLPVGHTYLDAPTQLDRTKVLNALKPLLESSSHKMIGQNIKYDQEVLKKYDIHLENVRFDTMLESYVLNSTGSRHDMESLALKYLGRKGISYEDLCGKGAKQIKFSEVSIEKASEYAAEDADITLQLHQTLYPKLQADAQLLKVFNEIEMPLVDVLADIEYRGVLIDAELLKKQSLELEKRIHILEEETFQEAGCVFNMSSPKQLQEILFKKMQIPVLKKTPTGQASTAEEVLQDLAFDYRLPKLILEYRSLSKLKSTYTDRLPEQINSKTGRVHTSYHQATTSTGRLSSSDPNLQNIPIRTEEGRRIRQAFIAAPGKKIVAGDYSQVELRIMAHLSGDKGLLEAFSNEQDIHRATAAQVFRVKLDQVSDEQRRKAKAINFGLIYGMSAFGLAKQINVSRDVAQNYIDMYFHQYPGVKTYMENTRKKAHERAFVETLFGRRLYLPDINAKQVMLQRASERLAINAPMQGTAADIIKRAMLTIQAWLKESKIDAQMIMQVHDELVFEVAEDQVDTLITHVRQLMQSAAKLDVPLIVDFGVGNNWDEAH